GLPLCHFFQDQAGAAAYFQNTPDRPLGEEAVDYRLVIVVPRRHDGVVVPGHVGVVAHLCLPEANQLLTCRNFTSLWNYLLVPRRLQGSPWDKGEGERILAVVTGSIARISA